MREAPTEDTSEAGSEGGLRFDLPSVFALLGVAYAVAIGALALRVATWSPEVTAYMLSLKRLEFVYCLSPLILFFVGLTLLVAGLMAYGWARNRQGHLTAWQTLSLLAGFTLPLLATLAYGYQWFLYFSSYNFGF